VTRNIPPVRLGALALSALALLLATSASGAPTDAYTASSQPTVVKPSESRTYSIKLKNDAASPDRAQRARIGIPVGFSVSAASAATSAAGICTASSWVADGTLISNGVVNLRKPGANTTELCPGATLTVSITASAPTEGVWTWTTELLRDTTAFALQGSQATVRVDGTAPVVSIDSAPTNPSNDPSPGFTFSANEPAVTFDCKLDAAAFASCASPRSYSALADGVHTFQVRGTDDAENVGSIVTHSWTIGTVAPLTTIESAPPTYSNSASATFTFSTTASDSSFECKLDADPFTACSSPKTYSALAEGLHSFQVRATDAATNQGDPIGHTWTVDTTAPNAAIETKPATPVNSPTASFSFTANETGSTFQCKLDAGGFAACVSPKQYGSLGDGLHTFAVEATDRAGNVGPAATYAWTVDSAPPNTLITANPPPASPSTSASFSFTATEVGTTFECRLDTQEWAPCLPPNTYAALSQGAHTFSVRATDGAGNVDPTPASVGWVVDTIPPDTTIDSRPASLTNSSTAAFAFSATEPGTFECKVDLEPDFSACGVSKTLTSLADGQHVLAVRARDAAGNPDPSPASYAWTVDTVPPQTTIGSTPPSQSASGLASFTFSSSEPGSTFECRVDSSAYTACLSPRSYLLLDGLHTFDVRATDAAKNTDTTAATYLWRIDTAEPDTTITSAPSGSVSSRDASIVFSSPDEGVTYECKLDAEPFAPCASPKLYANLPEASHTFEVRARDGAGNVDLSPAAASWVVDVTPPDTSILSGPPNPTSSQDATISFSSTESAVTYECKLDTAAFVACTSPKAYSNLSQAPHTVQVRATDAAGNVDATPATYSWTIDATPPDTTINSVPDNPTNKLDATFTFSSPDPSAGFECQLDGVAYAPCSSPKTYNALPDGSHAFNVRARDPAGNVDPTPATRTWTIDTVAPGPTITLPIDGSATNDTTPAFAGTAGTAVGDSAIVTVRVYAGPVAAGAPIHAFAVMRVGSNWAGASAPLAQGVYTGQAEQVDAAGNTGVSAPTTFTIDTGGPGAAIIEKPADPSSSTTATFRFSSTDPDATFSCRLDAGDFVACATPVTYTGLARGGHTFAINATDRAGNTGGNATYSWTILAPPPEPAPAPPPATPDVVPPHEVAKVRVKAANASVTLTWLLPTDPDFDRVRVMRTAPGKGVRAVAVYEGGNKSLTDRRLKNGVRYRYRIHTRDKVGNFSAGVVVAATPQAPLVAPLDGASVTAPPLLRWQATPRATYYNVQLWLVQSFEQAKLVRPVKVLSAWPATTRLKLSSRWRFGGKTYRLVPGRYRWYVFPGFGKRAAARYGAVLGQSSFTVKMKAAKTAKAR
jgi:large repetitive protein